MSEATITCLEARWRTEVYGLLARAFHAPPDDGQAERWGACSRTAAGVGLNLLTDRFCSLEGAARNDGAAALRQDFNDLFMVPGPKYVTPYESVYRDEPVEANGRVGSRTCGPSTQAVVAFYARIGLNIAKGYIELPDYVGLEMACMEYLCVREAECLEAGRDDAARNARALERAFVRDHLLRWVPDLETRIRAKAETGFYRALASAAREWIRQEAEGLCSET